MYQNRREAGLKLTKVLEEQHVELDLILAIPRGGVEVAEPIAEEWKCPLKVVIPRKIGAPGHEEMAVGAVAWEGTVILNDSIIRTLGIPHEYIKEKVERERQEILRRTAQFPYTPQEEEIKGKKILLVDDGIATGYTVKATIAGLKKLHPAKIYLAVPVGAPDTISMLEKEVDAVFCPLVPIDFWAVGQFYKDFSQTSDERVIEILKKSIT